MRVTERVRRVTEGTDRERKRKEKEKRECGENRKGEKERGMVRRRKKTGRERHEFLVGSIVVRVAERDGCVTKK